MSENVKINIKSRYMKVVVGIRYVISGHSDFVTKKFIDYSIEVFTVICHDEHK